MVAGRIVAFSCVAIGIGVALAATPSLASDSDGDGIDDASDNCINVANATQCDTDSDGYGNHCDGDFDNDGVVDEVDFSSYFNPDFMSGSGSAVGTDMNCDGAMTEVDFAVFAERNLSGTVGPSGLACAGTIPCPAP